MPPATGMGSGCGDSTTKRQVLESCPGVLTRVQESGHTVSASETVPNFVASIKSVAVPGGSNSNYCPWRRADQA
jgi:hypothetical protein